MSVPRSLLGMTATLAAWIALAIPADATINYSISLGHPEQHRFHVNMTIPNATGNLELQMAAWDALYQIRDFADRVTGLRARDDLGPAPLEKVDKETWKIKAAGTVTVEYDTEWDEPGPFNSQLDREHAFINFATVLLYVTDRHGEDVQVQFQDVPQNWRLAVELHPGPNDPSGMTIVARNFDALADAPAELGNLDDFSFPAGGRTIRVAVRGKGWNRAEMTDMLTRITNYETTLMGGAPDQEYLFLLDVGFDAGGGMEHDDCTAISVMSAAQLPDLSAHEFFHQWNVKRLRPKTLEPLDRTREMYTRALWFAEGVTNTYAHYTLVRTGLYPPQWFYDELALEYDEVESHPAHLWQSAEESSLDAWFEKYSLYAEPDFSISYYSKGDVLGVMLDIVLRQASNNRVSLDDVMRQMYDDFAKKGRYYNDSADVRATAESVLRHAGVSGPSADLESFFAQYVAGTKEIPFAELLSDAGLVLQSTGEGGVIAYRIVEMAHPTDLQLRIREGLLHGVTSQP